MSSEAATTQEFWNTVGGPAWVAQQDHLDRHLRPLTDVTLRRITLRPGQRVLDVGCGAADFTFAAAALVQPGGSVTGIDFAEPMLALARRRAAERAVTAVGFVAADIETWQPDAPYDAAVSRLGMPPTAAAMSSVRNALVPGGRFAFTCFRGVLENQWMVVPTLAVMEVMPFDLPDPAAPSGPFALADPDQVRRLLGGAGFDGIELTPVDYQVEMTGADGAVDVVLSVGPASAVMATADTDQQAKARQEISHALAEHGSRLALAAWLVTAQRPQ